MVGYNDITVAMVTFNRPALLIQTLPTYLRFSEVLVWDNASVFGNQIALKALTAKHLNVKPTWNNENVGWPKAMNRMIAKAKTDWVLLTADDMLLGVDFIETLNCLLRWKPNLEQIYVNTFDTFLFHKKTIARMGWWDEEQPNVSPFWEDNDWYLRLNEMLGFSPGYVYPGEHIRGAEREKRLRFASKREDMERMDNIVYFSNCRWGISSVNFNIKELSRDASYIQKYNINKGKTSEQYYLEKWKETGNEKDLLNKDGTFWKRISPEKDQHPEITKQYREKYL